MKMNILRRLIIPVFVILLIVVISYSVHFDNKREYTRSYSVDGKICYPRDTNYNWFQGNILVPLGTVFGILLPIFVIYIWYQGTRITLKKRFPRLSSNLASRTFLFILSFWFLIIGLYSLVTIPVGTGFILQPFYGHKIFYGGIPAMLKEMQYQMLNVQEDQTVPEEERKEKLQYLRERYRVINEEWLEEQEYVKGMFTHPIDPKYYH